jgi:hypothetical protein
MHVLRERLGAAGRILASLKGLCDGQDKKHAEHNTWVAGLSGLELLVSKAKMIDLPNNRAVPVQELASALSRRADKDFGPLLESLVESGLVQRHADGRIEPAPSKAAEVRKFIVQHVGLPGIMTDENRQAVLLRAILEGQETIKDTKGEMHRMCKQYTISDHFRYGGRSDWMRKLDDYGVDDPLRQAMQALGAKGAVKLASCMYDDGSSDYRVEGYAIAWSVAEAQKFIADNLPPEIPAQ